MATDGAAAPVELVDLRQVQAEAMSGLLEEETEQWRTRLHWDFGASAELVRRFVGMRALNGSCILAGGTPVGYAYYVSEERKGLIGDLYVSGEYRSRETESALLRSVLNGLLESDHIRRVECQLMMLTRHSPSQLPLPEHLKAYERQFMHVGLRGAAGLPRGEAATWMEIENWFEFRQEESAHLIAQAYEDHIDAQINDQYRSVAGARSFLTNIVQYPGCGTFFRPASFLAIDRRTRRASGLVLSSLVGPEVGHITQLCVSPRVKGSGAGYELLRLALAALAAHGCKEATLTVTAANTKAVRLYESIGFDTLSRFSAWVWDGL